MNKYALSILGIIPARYSSTRLPGKVLVDINGKPMLQRVWEAACRSKYLSRIIIATDDERIENLCLSIGAEYVLTPSELSSGTERAIYAYRMLNEDSELILNIQGDEPLLSGSIIDHLIESFVIRNSDVGTLIKRIDKNEDIFNPSVVKVTLNNESNALYFSRSPIPYLRDYPQSEWHKVHTFWKHIGIYIYKQSAFLNFSVLANSELDKFEQLEQLRYLQNGYSIHCIETDQNLISIDTQDDLEFLKQYLTQIKM